MGKQAHVKAYPQKFRHKVVQLMEVGQRSSREVAAEFGISEDSVRRWVQQAEREEFIRLRRGNKRLRLEREVLSTAAAWFAWETASIP